MASGYAFPHTNVGESRLLLDARMVCPDERHGRSPATAAAPARPRSLTQGKA